eukprot:2811508-Ditylum_brightwellii.AAC.1
MLGRVPQKYDVQLNGGSNTDIAMVVPKHKTYGMEMMDGLIDFWKITTRCGCRHRSIRSLPPPK